MSYYKGKKVFIVGGSKGIGRRLAERLARHGASVWVAARGQGALDETVASLKSSNPSGNHGSVSMDVTDYDAVKAGCDAVLAGLGGMDILVCNSGFALPALFEDCDVADFDRMMDVNFKGHVHVTHALKSHFIQQGSGDICLVSSMMGFLPLYGYAAYSASKFAIVGFGESIRQELKRYGVRVTLYYPPTTETPGLEKENETKPPAVWALEADSAFSKVFPADEVAISISDSIAKGVVHGMVGWQSKLVYHLNRLMPGLTRTLTDQEVQTAVEKVAKV